MQTTWLAEPPSIKYLCRFEDPFPHKTLLLLGSIPLLHAPVTTAPILQQVCAPTPSLHAESVQMESVRVKVLLLGCVRPVELPKSGLFVLVDHMMPIVPQEAVRSPTGVHNHLLFPPISYCSIPTFFCPEKTRSCNTKFF